MIRVGGGCESDRHSTDRDQLRSSQHPVSSELFLSGRLSQTENERDKDAVEGVKIEKKSTLIYATRREKH